MPELSDIELIGAAVGASRSNRDSALRLAGLTAERLRGGERLPSQAVDFLAEAFEAIAQGQSADLALGLKSTKRGRPRDRTKGTRDLFLVFDLMKEIESRRTFDDAIESVARTHNVSESTVKQAFTQHRKNLDSGR